MVRGGRCFFGGFVGNHTFSSQQHSGDRSSVLQGNTTHLSRIDNTCFQQVFELLGAGGEVVATTLSDGQGRYGFLNVPQGTLSLRVDGKTMLPTLQVIPGRVTLLEPLTLN